MKKLIAKAVLSVALMSPLPMVADETVIDQEMRHNVNSEFMFLISPMFGYNRDELTMRGGPGGRDIITTTDTKPIYGLYAMMASPRFVINDFLFYTEPNDADVLGNLIFANIYGNPDATLT